MRVLRIAAVCCSWFWVVGQFGNLTSSRGTQHNKIGDSVEKIDY